MMTGYLSTQGVSASEGRVGKALKNVHPTYHRERQQVPTDVFNVER